VNNMALELCEIGMAEVPLGQELRPGTIVCPNPDCCGGYMRSHLDPSAIRVCPSCDGFGYLRSAAENRKRYYAIRNMASEIELQSHKGRGVSAKVSKQTDSEAGDGMLDRAETGSHYDEHMIVNGAGPSSCYRVS
jgi:hypothetical protein